MSYDESLAERVRALLGDRPDVEEKRMFGGVAFLVRGNMSVGVHERSLIVRMEPRAGERALDEKGARVFDLTGRPLRGWVQVGPSGTSGARALGKWVSRGYDFAASLPPK